MKLNDDTDASDEPERLSGPLRALCTGIDHYH